MTTPSPGTIDITELVEQVRKAWVDWGVAQTYAAVAAIPGIGWFGTLMLNTLGKAVIRAIFDFISKKGEMMAFFLNTAIRKASQAKDFTDAVKRKNALPPTATKEEFERAEQDQMVAFRNFVMVTN